MKGLPSPEPCCFYIVIARVSCDDDKRWCCISVTVRYRGFPHLSPAASTLLLHVSDVTMTSGGVVSASLFDTGASLT
ncbi:hypothetical protein J6590_021586 [Homalodisca vitripennis]|nr:hypothetical protein J6590_021586 [Homalodisca vitripennis]